MFVERSLPAAVLLVCVTGAAQAHHSRAAYDATKEVVFEGTVAKLDWMNPHISMTVQTQGADGAPLLQDIEVMSVSEARAMGLSRDAIAQGAHVIVRAHPGRGGAGARAVGLDVKTSDGRLFPLNTDAGFAVTPSGIAEAQGLAGRWAPSVGNFNATFPVLFGWPFTDANRARVQAVGGAAGSLLGICADYPPPLLSIFPDLREIKIGSSTIEIRFEAQGQNVTRVIHLDQASHPKDVAPSLLGHSIGRWAQGVLVVDTVAFTPHPVGVMFGVASSPRKHLVEKLALADDKRHLRYDVTLEDAEKLTGPASMSTVWDYRPDLTPSGVACNPESARKVLAP
jgi:hypothetical protein